MLSWTGPYLSQSREMSNDFTLRRACVEDADFISVGIREAERCHAGIGIFDALVGKSKEDIAKSDRTAPDEVSAYLKHCLLNDEHSHVYIGNFLVLVEAETGKLAACSCNYPYPEHGLTKSTPGFKTALQTVLHYSDEDVEKAMHRWDFLDNSFPDVDYSNCWSVESVYVSPSFRGCGLGFKIVKACMEDQVSRRASMANTEERRFLITCAVGNEVARSLYEKLGFKLAGQGESAECMEAINCSGFYVLSTRP